MMTRPDMEKHAYQKFLQHGVDRDTNDPKKPDTCIDHLFDLTFPIYQQDQNVSLSYVSHDIRFCSNDGEEVHLSEAGEDFLFADKITGRTPSEYAEQCELVVTLHRIIWEGDGELDEREITSIKEQDVIFGPLPRMTVNGTFIHNGIEKWYAGEGLATQRMDKLYGQAFYEVERATNAKLRRFVGETMLPFDFIETWPLEIGTGEFLDGLIPVVLH